MYGWMGGWVHAWMDGWVDRWMDGWMDGWMGGWMNQWMNDDLAKYKRLSYKEQANEWLSEQSNKWMKECMSLQCAGIWGTVQLVAVWWRRHPLLHRLCQWAATRLWPQPALHHHRYGSASTLSCRIASAIHMLVVVDEQHRLCAMWLHVKSNSTFCFVAAHLHTTHNIVACSNTAWQQFCDYC